MKLAGSIGLLVCLALVSCATKTTGIKPQKQHWALACKKALTDYLGSMDSVRIRNLDDVARGTTQYLEYDIANAEGGPPRSFQFSCEQALPSYMAYDGTPERWTFRIDSRPWDLAYQAGCYQEFCQYIPPNMMNRSTQWYMPKGQLLENWQEKVTSNFYAVPDATSMGKWSQDFVRQLTKECPSLSRKTLLDTADAFVIEFHHSGCNGTPAQYEVQKIARTASGMAILAYTKLGAPPVGAQRDQWRAALLAAKVRPDGEVQPEIQRLRDQASAKRASFEAICAQRFNLTPELRQSEEGRKRLAVMAGQRPIQPDAQQVKACLSWAKGKSN
jgi:hypothetical protein